MDNSHYYFAYGSNMSLVQLQQRMGDGPNIIIDKSKTDQRLNWEGETVLEDVTTIGKAVLDNYKLTFNKVSNIDLKSAYANVSPAINERVEGVLYKLSDKHFKVLDYYEGVHSESYMRSLVKVRDVNNQVYDAVIYVAYPNKTSENCYPSESYLVKVLIGANEFNLSETTKKLKNWKTAEMAVIEEAKINK